MKMKDLAMIGLGMGAALMYQKYGVPMINKASKAMNKEIKKLKNELNQMM